MHGNQIARALPYSVDIYKLNVALIIISLMLSVLLCLLTSVSAFFGWGLPDAVPFKITYPVSSTNIILGQQFTIWWQGSGCLLSCPFIKIFSPNGLLFDWMIAGYYDISYDYRIPKYAPPGRWTVCVVEGLDCTCSSFTVSPPNKPPPIPATTTHTNPPTSIITSNPPVIVTTTTNQIVTSTITSTDESTTYITTTTATVPQHTVITVPGVETYVIYSSGADGWVTIPYTVTYQSIYTEYSTQTIGGDSLSTATLTSSDSIQESTAAVILTTSASILETDTQNESITVSSTSADVLPTASTTVATSDPTTTLAAGITSNETRGTTATTTFAETDTITTETPAGSTVNEPISSSATEQIATTTYANSTVPLSASTSSTPEGHSSLDASQESSSTTSVPHDTSSVLTQGTTTPGISTATPLTTAPPTTTVSPTTTAAPQVITTVISTYGTEYTFTYTEGTGPAHPETTTISTYGNVYTLTYTPNAAPAVRLSNLVGFVGALVALLF